MRNLIVLLLAPVIAFADPIVPGNRNIQSIDYTSNALGGVLFDGNDYSMCSKGNESLQGANFGFMVENIEKLKVKSLKGKLFPGSYPKQGKKTLKITPCISHKKDSDTGQYTPRFQMQRRIDVREIVYKGERSFESTIKTSGWRPLRKLSAYDFEDIGMIKEAVSLACAEEESCDYYISSIEYRIIYDGIIVLNLHSSELYGS